MDNSQISKAANILYNSRMNLKRIEKLPEDCNPDSLEDSYLIQNKLAEKYLSSKKENFIIGIKIGCTNKAAQEQINVKEPFFGNIFSDNISKSDCIINSKKYFNPFVEPEFSFLMKDSLDIVKAPFGSDEILKNINAVLPSIEIVDSRYNDWTSVGIKQLVADNAVHAHWVYANENNNLNSFNFNNHEVNLYINSKLIEKGNSRNVMKNPINSLTWLINKLASKGKTLPKNFYISTGTCTKAIPINKGDEIFADFGSLGKVNFFYK